MSEYKTVDWNHLSDWGLIVEINKNILHPLGLAICRDPDTGMSEGAIISDDYVWEYPKHVYEQNNEKFKKFKENRIEILSELLVKDEQ